MDWSDVGKKIISIGAPLLGGALGGPAGAAIGQVVASQFGITDEDPAKVLAAITADPEARLKLTELEFRHSERLIELENEHFKLQSADTQQARVTHKDHWMPSVLTCILALMVALMVAALIWISIPPDNKEVVYLMVGQLIGGFSTAIAYWLGSSRSSASKDARIASMIER